MLLWSPARRPARQSVRVRPSDRFDQLDELARPIRSPIASSTAATPRSQRGLISCCPARSPHPDHRRDHARDAAAHRPARRRPPRARLEIQISGDGTPRNLDPDQPEDHGHASTETHQSGPRRTPGPRRCSDTAVRGLITFLRGLESHLRARARLLAVPQLVAHRPPLCGLARVPAAGLPAARRRALGPATCAAIWTPGADSQN